MNGTELSRFADLIERDTVPLWLRDQIREHLSEILAAVESGKTYVCRGPNGETVSLEGKRAA